MRKYLQPKLFLNLLLLVGLMTVPAQVAVAASESPANQQPVTQAYGTDGVLQQGMIVRLNDTEPTKANALESDRASDMHGVVVAANDAALTLSSDAAARQVYVSTYGRYEVLVSDQNGAIKAGDFISISALNGIGMKADSKQPVVLGRAAEPFSGAGQVVGTATLKDKAGKSREVSLGRILVDMTISHNPLQVQAQSKGLTGYLQSISNGLVGKTVSPMRIYLSIIVLFLAAAVSCSIMYSGVRASIGAIGRNPLARKSIMRSLMQVIMTSLIIFIIGIFAVYLLLKL